MYFIDSKKITNNLNYMDSLLTTFESQPNWAKDTVSELAVARIANVLIEAIIDVGNTMIDGFIMRDPGSYEDIIDILVDEKVITADMDAPIKQLISHRRVLVRDVLEVDVTALITTLNEVLPILKQFKPAVEAFVKKEAGIVVTAFIPEEK
ncbi:DUF86 domain-containing protein [Kurthia sibirica]|uniref:DUF86 domain-containing protein n=1 Tax=Kurthia sibirica TaxID=202750 RepID=A0A2U3AHZ1_9BACL|nr:DUF86 domain-containing protein [Kurthia sibirica]PWI24176.1 DUF86 domain-containing protein [Kurthia sibirica]GEK34700.1 UPF0331 protein YutE [Kurthia sibirica]